MDSRTIEWDRGVDVATRILVDEAGNDGIDRRYLGSIGSSLVSLGLRFNG